MEILQDLCRSFQNSNVVFIRNIHETGQRDLNIVLVLLGEPDVQKVIFVKFQVFCYLVTQTLISLHK